MDTSLTCCGFREFESLDRDVRARIAVGVTEVDALATYSVVSGHFSLASLGRIANPSSIATVLREPRSRTLSHYAFWRVSPTPRMRSQNPALDHALRPLDEFLAEPLVARATDNLVCRMLLDGDDRLPEVDFIRHEDVDELASLAIARLETLGFVGVLELRESMWQGLSEFFGVSLVPGHENATASFGATSEAPPANFGVSTRTLELLEARTAVDSIIYRHVLKGAGWSGPSTEALAAAAFANGLVSFGNATGSSADEWQTSARTAGELRDELARKESELQRSAGDLQEERGRLAATETRLRETEYELRRSDRDLEEGRERLAATETRIREMDDELCRNAGDLQVGREHLATTEMRIREMEEELRRAKDRLRVNNAWLDAVQGSVSWRLTAPARAAKRKLKGARTLFR